MNIKYNVQSKNIYAVWIINDQCVTICIGLRLRVLSVCTFLSLGSYCISAVGSTHFPQFLTLKCALPSIPRHFITHHSSPHHSSLVTRHLVICLSHFVTHHFVTRRSSRVVLYLVTCLSHLVTSFITRHSSVTSHAPLESYKRATAVAVGYIPCAVNTATVS